MVVFLPRPGQAAQALRADLGVVAERQAEVVVEAVEGRSHRPRRDPDAVRAGNLGELERAPVRQPDPEAQAARGPAPGSSPRSRPGCASMRSSLSRISSRRCSAHGVDPIEQAERHHLGDHGCTEVRHGLQAAEMGDRLAWAADPADAHACPEELAQRADREHGRVGRVGRDRRWRRLGGERQLGDRRRPPQ